MERERRPREENYRTGYIFLMTLAQKLGELPKALVGAAMFLNKSVANAGRWGSGQIFK